MIDTLEFTFSASRPLQGRAHTGVVASGNCEVLLEPSDETQAHVIVRTSVNGFETTWRAVLERFFARHPILARIEINDFGATPAVVVASTRSGAGAARVTYVRGESFAEMLACERACSLLDAGTARTILGPFDRVTSPYVAPQGIVAQADDGVTIARGLLGGVRACIVATEGRYLGGSVGAVGGAKIAAALECAYDDVVGGAAVRVVLALDTGGIRLQEANLGILAVAEICDAIVALRRHTPVLALVAGRVGVYGGMSIAASLCDERIVTEGARIGLNGPDVVETEAGVEEFDAADRPLIWQLTGGRRRVEQGIAQRLVDDDVPAIRAALIAAFQERGA